MQVKYLVTSELNTSKIFDDEICIHRLCVLNDLVKMVQTLVVMGSKIR